MTAMLDAIASTGSKAIVATLEDKTKSPEYLASKCILDEGPETFWKAAFGSILAKLKNNFAPFIPEQFVNIPGDLLGAYVHWRSAAHQSLNKTISQAGKKFKSSSDLLDKFYDNFIKTPTSYILNLIGLDRHEHTLSFGRFGLANLAAFAFGTYSLMGSDDENLPGVNIDSSEPKHVTTYKTLGYVITEQVMHVASQWMRYYEDYKKEFGEKFALSKSLANVINEKTFPGNFLSAIGACLSTLWFGKTMSKSAAAALGEIVPKAFTRLLETRLRRTTKDTYDENSLNQRRGNYRFHNAKWFNSLLDIIDYPFAILRELTVNHVVAPIFKPSDMSVNDFRKELYDSFDLPVETLKSKKLLMLNNNHENGLEQITQVEKPGLVTT
jgi:hypothetical protein